jgi:hypothetical protein
MRRAGASIAWFMAWTSAGTAALAPSRALIRQVHDPESFHAWVARSYVLPPALKQWVMAVEEPTADLSGTVDFDQVPAEQRARIPWPFNRLLRGQFDFLARGRLSGREGKGYFDLERLQIGTIGIPHWLIRALAPPDAVDGAEAERLVLIFPLPDGVESLELEDRSVVLRIDPTPRAADGAAPR